MSWYTDPEGDYWRHSKMGGGLQAEDKETGRFGDVVRLSDAVEQFHVQLLPAEIGMVFDAFDRIRVQGMDYTKFRNLRASMVKIVEYLMVDKAPPPQLADVSDNPKFTDRTGEPLPG